MDTRLIEELVNVRDAAKESRRNMETVHRWIWSGKLPAQKLGNQLFIGRSDLRILRRNNLQKLFASMLKTITMNG